VPEERLQKAMARAGVASRRKCEELIASGRVRVNGRVVTELGTKVDLERDVVEVDSRRIEPEAFAYYLVYKPPGYLSAVRDDRGRKTVVDLVRDGRRLYPVGRLDYRSEGLMILTNDGELAVAVTHPSSSVGKTYEVEVSGAVGEDELGRLREGVRDGGELLRADAVELLSSSNGGSSLRFVLHEGKKRHIRRMCEAVGCPVLRLVRTGIGFLTLSGLRPGDSRPMSGEEIERLRGLCGLEGAGVGRSEHRRMSGRRSD